MQTITKINEYAMSHENTRVLRIFLLIATGISLLLVWFAAVGVRGTDQYWYIADALRLVRGESLVTNTYFPGEILRNGEVPSPNYISHNSPMLYLVAIVVSLTSFSVYKSWILLNVIFHFVIAASIFKIVEKYTDQNTSYAATAIYLLSPIAIWQTLNPLLEMYFSVLVATVLLCYVLRDRVFSFWLLFVLLLLGVVSHPIFVLPAFILGAFAIYDKRNVNKACLVFGSVAYFSLVFLCLHRKGVWFPSSFQPSLQVIITSAVPNKSNMFWQYSETLPVIDSEFLIAKLIRAVEIHVLTLRNVPLYVFTNIAILMAIYLTISSFRKWWSILLPLGLFGCLYLAMIVLQQNQPRYQQIVAPVSFVFIGVGIYQLLGKEWLRSRLCVAAVGISMCLIASVSLYIANTARVEANNQKLEVKKLRSLVSTFPESTRFVGINVKPHNPFSYIVSPREMLFVRTDMLEEKSIEKAMELFKPDYYLIMNDVFSVDGVPMGIWESDRFGKLFVYKYER